jgi:hypothetical protein
MLMRSCVLTNVFVSLFLLLGGAISAEEPRALLDRSIQAHGGAARLERTKKGHLKAKSEGKQSDAPFKVEIEEWFDLPNRYSRTIEGSSNGVATHFEEVYTGKECWIRKGDGPAQVRQPLPVLQNWYAILALLLSLRDEAVQLKSLPDETKNGRTFAGFHATSLQGVGDFFFDKSTGLLAKIQQIRPNHLGGQELIAEASYDDYRDIQGVHYPMRFKTTSGTTDTTTVTISSIEFGDKMDENVFRKAWLPAPERQASSETSEKTPAPRDRMLIIATVGAGAVIGAVWFIVRASKRGKRETPPS